MIKYQNFVKLNYKNVSHLPNNKRLKQIGILWKDYKQNYSQYGGTPFNKFSCRQHMSEANDRDEEFNKCVSNANTAQGLNSRNTCLFNPHEKKNSRCRSSHRGPRRWFKNKVNGIKIVDFPDQWYDLNHDEYRMIAQGINDEIRISEEEDQMNVCRKGIDITKDRHEELKLCQQNANRVKELNPRNNCLFNPHMKDKQNRCQASFISTVRQQKTQMADQNTDSKIKINIVDFPDQWYDLNDDGYRPIAEDINRGIIMNEEIILESFRKYYKQNPTGTLDDFILNSDVENNPNYIYNTVEEFITGEGHHRKAAGYRDIYRPYYQKIKQE